MSFDVVHSPGHMTINIKSWEDIELFKVMVNRAANCWDRAPANMKTFMDIVTVGAPQQVYEDLGSEVKQP